MSKFRSWLDNYWYHYKWHTFFGLFAAALVIIAGISLIGKKEYDVYAVYAGPHAFVENEAGDLESDISKYCKTDYTGNGKIETNILSFVYVSPERAKEYLENGTFYSEPINYEARKSIVSQLNSGDSFIYLMDAYEDIDDDIANACYNPFMQFREREDFDDYCKQILTMMIAECSREFEKLPILTHAEILRNILYSGVWCRFEAICEKRQSVNNQENKS